MNRETSKTRPWDAVDFLIDEESIQAYREAVTEDGDPDLIAAAEEDVKRARERLAAKRP